MNTKRKRPGLTVSTRRTATAKALRTRIEEETPDPVYRLTKAKGGESQQPSLADTYHSLNLLSPPYSVPLMMRLADLDPYLAGVIDAIATNVATGDLTLKWTGDGDEPQGERETLEAFFGGMSTPENPNPLAEEIKACAVDYLTFGNWNMEIIEAGRAPVRLLHAPAELVRVRGDQTGYVMIKNGMEAPFEIYGNPQRDKSRHQLLRAINKQPGHRVYGKPAILTLLNTVLLDASHDEKNLDWFDQGVLADLLVLLEESVDEDIRKRISADYQNTGDGTQSMFILDGVGKGLVEQIKHELEGKSFDTMEENNRQRILTALRVPPAKAAIFEDANRANTLTQDETFRNEVTEPLQEMFTTRFGHIIRHLFEMKHWKVQLKSKALKNLMEEAKVNQIYLDSGVKSVNEVRPDTGLGSVEGGDRRVMNTPLGLVDLSNWEIAVAAEPAALERLAETGNRAAVGLVLRLMELRRDLANAGHAHN